jgi:hypothetical protein
MRNLKTEISKIASAIVLRSEGMGLRATGRVLGVKHETIAEWERRFAESKQPLMLYALVQTFIKLTFEGDEIYTKVDQNFPQDQSEGWTAIILERSSRFLLEQKCGHKDQKLFSAVMGLVAEMIEKTGELEFFSDGERRYGNTLFEMCSVALKTGKVGRPKQTFPKGVKVRVKNKGDQAHKLGPKKEKYQQPKAEHPEKTNPPKDSDTHANHTEAYNASLRRRNSAFRRRTNMYAKSVEGLQRTLDLHLIIHDFVRPPFTLGAIPAVVLGLMDQGLEIVDILKGNI